MKKMKNLILIMIIMSLSFLYSCKKDYNVTPDKTTIPTKDMVVSSNFDWKTSKEITLNVIGMKDVNPSVSNIIYVKSFVNENSIYIKDLLNMNTNYTIKFVVPQKETKVILVYGTKTKIIDLLSNTISYDYN